MVGPRWPSPSPPTPQPGEAALVEGAAGGVGSLLVQMAKNAGARVVAVASGAQKLDLARQLGADAAIAYREPDWVDRVRAEVGGVDVVYDGVGGQTGRDAFTLLKPAGRFCAFGMASGSFASIPDAARPDVTRSKIAALTRQQTVELVRSVLAQAVDGRLRPVIGHRFPLERADDAHAAIEGRSTLGKTLLVPHPTPR